MRALYPRLAADGIRKNSKMYFPYMLSCMGMVMMFYIIHSLSYSPLLHETSGGRNIEIILSLGKFVIAVFALLFLFYTNSFLVRKRYKEFGLYSVLGMDKAAICRVVFWESLAVSLIGLVGGTGVGILLSKLCELGLLRAIHHDIDYEFTVSPEAIYMTLLIFGAIFLLLMLKSLWQVWHLRPLDLLQSDSLGEKPLRANWVFAVLGIIILGTAYYLAVSIESPMTAIFTFFIAVIMVIVATYMLFMSGSVALCKLLQKNKKYYYKKQHFVSVSSMAYRMKRNGAGLASICILSTMVLVMISSSSSLYFGANDAINARYPRGTMLAFEMKGIENLSGERTDRMKAEYEKVFESYGVSPENEEEYRYCSIAGLLSGNKIDVESNKVNELSLDYDDVRILYFVCTDDYNAYMGTSVSLENGEAMLCTRGCGYDLPTLAIGDVELKIKGKLDDFIPLEEYSTMPIPAFMLVIPDFEMLRPLQSFTMFDGTSYLSSRYYYGYDTDCDDETAVSVFRDQIEAAISLDFMYSDDGYRYTASCLAQEKDDFFTTFGGLFFLGIILSVTFIFAAVMIIYYKQVYEGFEDKARFEIMQKVGMTDRDIKKSINSQVLTVFFAPLITAGIHLAFAFPLVWKLLQLFALKNLTLVILVNIGAFLVFGVFYALIYKITARAYYSIVRGK